ncbi:glycosyltransferase family 8 protein [Agrobacterium sp. BA1120]|uniref:glycosyltransferase family 8 protein n=1 Tax=Agrobacterium sp. BA1120 TaxID=3228927 RepID=UPI00336AC855
MLLACCIDRNYVELAGVMLRSVFKNGNIGDIDICILGDGLRSKDKLMITQAAGRSVNFIDMTQAMLSSIRYLKTTSFWSRAIYGRLLLPEIVGDRYQRIVYLDSDVIVKRDIRHLFELDMGDALIAGVAKHMPEHNKRLGRPEGSLYFNSGVFVLDATKWRAKNLTEKSISLIKTNDFTFMDQDVLNIIATDRFTVLPPIWNAEKGPFDDAAIVHFTHAKPDSVECRHPERDLYFHFRAETPWASSKLKTKRTRTIRRIKHSISYRLNALKSKLVG